MKPIDVVATVGRSCFGAALALSLCSNIAVAQGATASKEAPPELVQAAKAEGHLSIYHANPDELARWVADAFSKKYNIEVELFRAPSALLSVRFANEAETGTVANDILYTTDAAIWSGHPDWFTTLSADRIPNLARVTSPDNLKPNAIGTIEDPFVVIYNTDKLKAEQAPQTWEDLGDPKWKGQFVLSDPRSSSSYIKIMAMLRDRNPGLLERIAANAPQMVDSASPGAQQVAAGAAQFVTPALGLHAVNLMAQGAPLDYLTLGEPELTTNFWAGVTAKAPHPNAAQLYMNFILSDEGVSAFCNVNGKPKSAMSVLDPQGKLGCVEMKGTPVYLSEKAPTDEVKAAIVKELGLH